MVNTKCSRCGDVNFAGDQTCRVCGVTLLVERAFSHYGRGPNVDWNVQTARSTPTLAPIGEFWGVGDVLGPTLSIFFKNIWLITKIVFVIVAPFEVFKVLSNTGRTTNDWQVTFGLFVLGLLCNVLIAPALIYALMKLLQTGTAPSVTESYRWGLGKLGRLTLYAFAVVFLEALGTLFLVIPGIMLMIAFYVVYPVTVLENNGFEETLRRSLSLTNGFRWKIFGAVLVLSLLLGVISLTTSGLSVFFVFNGINLWPVSVVAAIIEDILDQGTTVLSLVIYLSILRTLESGQRQY